MFEIVAAICLSLSDGPCRDGLIPGFEAPTQAACEARLGDVQAPDWADAPPRCVPMGEDLEVQEVAPGVFVHMGRIREPNADNRGDVSNLGFVIGETSVAVIDTGTARWMGEALYRAIRKRTEKPISHVILTHMHPDHVLGTTPLREAGALVMGHARLPRSLADRQANYRESLARLIGAPFLGTEAAPVDQVVETAMEIDLGNRVLSLTAWPTAHTGTDITVLDSATGTFFVGDLVFHQHTPALDGKLRGWQAVLAEITAWEVAQVVPGHGGPVLDWPGDAQPQRRYLERLEADTRAAIDAGQRMGDAVEEIAQSEAPNWELFDAYNPRNATVAFTELEWE